MKRRLSINSREAIIGLLLFLAIGPLKPWWLFVLVAAVGGAWTAARSSKSLLAIGSLAGAAWVVAALFRDAVSGMRASQRLAGLFSIPHPVLLYVFLFVLAGFLACLAALTARLIWQLVYLGEKP